MNMLYILNEALILGVILWGVGVGFRVLGFWCTLWFTRLGEKLYPIYLLLPGLSFLPRTVKKFLPTGVVGMLKFVFSPCGVPYPENCCTRAFVVLLGRANHRHIKSDRVSKNQIPGTMSASLYIHTYVHTYILENLSGLFIYLFIFILLLL
jgi:hypothetical protein